LPPSKLHRATVVHHRPAGRGFHRLVLQAPALASTAVPGQFVMLRVSDNLDPLLARPFGISAVIQKRSIELYYQVVGRGTGLLTAARPGTTLALHGPLGNGFPVPEKGTVPLLVAGGSGFPPLLFFASCYGKRAVLFAGSRDKECLPPAAAMKDFRSRVQGIRYATEDGSKGTCGFVTDTLAAYLDRGAEAGSPVIYACGPRAMLAAVAGLAARHEVPCYVSMEERMACGLGVCMGCSIAMKAGGYTRACKEGPVFRSSDIDWNDRVVLPVVQRK
jgi:dihydroorotate dehydrogenase electron transfer subunit